MTKKHDRWGWVFVSPFIIGFIVFTAWALGFTLYVAFTDYDLINAPKFVGFKNFANALSDANTWISLRNILFYFAIVTSVGVFMSCILATMLNQKRRGTTFFRVLYYIPVITPVVAVTFVWLNIYNPTFGVLNKILALIRIDPLKYVFSDNVFEAFLSMAVIGIWQSIGSTILYVLGGLQNVSDDVMEAATIDGANVVTKFFKITMPLISPTIFFLVIVNLIHSLQAFEKFLVMGKYTTANISVPGTLLYKEVFVNLRIGYGAAIGWIFFAVALALTLFRNYAEKRWVHYV